jgi:pre-mRNA-splicing factor ATP-dependent RNA helicase DHX38/PRP16
MINASNNYKNDFNDNNSNNVNTQVSLNEKERNKVLELPIYKYENEIINRLKNENILVVVGETGSGKTTQIPKILYNNNFCGNKMICVTQPRRVAAISVAFRVSKEVN